MRPSFVGVYIVDVGVHVFREFRRILQGDLEADTLRFA